MTKYGKLLSCNFNQIILLYISYSPSTSTKSLYNCESLEHNSFPYFHPHPYYHTMNSSLKARRKTLWKCFLIILFKKLWSVLPFVFFFVQFFILLLNYDIRRGEKKKFFKSLLHFSLLASCTHAQLKDLKLYFKFILIFLLFLHRTVVIVLLVTSTKQIKFSSSCTVNVQLKSKYTFKSLPAAASAQKCLSKMSTLRHNQQEMALVFQVQYKERRKIFFLKRTNFFNLDTGTLHFVCCYFAAHLFIQPSLYVVYNFVFSCI